MTSAQTAIALAVALAFSPGVLAAPPMHADQSMHTDRQMPERSNKDGKLRGKKRAAQVHELNAIKKAKKTPARRGDAAKVAPELDKE